MGEKTMKITDFSDYDLILNQAPPLLFFQSRSKPKEVLQIKLSGPRFFLLRALCRQRIKDGDAIHGGWVSKDQLSITADMEKRGAWMEGDPPFLKSATKDKWHRGSFADNLYKMKNDLSSKGVPRELIESIRDYLRLTPQIKPNQIVLVGEWNPPAQS